MSRLAALIRNVRQAASLPGLADAVIAGLGGVPGVVGVAMIGLSRSGTPALWIGDDGFEPACVQAFLDGARGDPCEERRALSQAMVVDLPIAGASELAGAIRIITCEPVSPHELALLSAVVSLRLSVLGIDVPFEDHLEPVRLSDRQREIAWLVARGCTNAEIAGMVGCTSHAVKKQVSRVCELLEVSNRTELAAVTARWTDLGARPTPRQRPIYRSTRLVKAVS